MGEKEDEMHEIVPTEPCAAARRFRVLPCWTVMECDMPMNTFLRYLAVLVVVIASITLVDWYLRARRGGAAGAGSGGAGDRRAEEDLPRRSDTR
jgi:hypothetical protein